MKKYLAVLITILFISCSPNDDDKNIAPRTQEVIETKYLPTKLTSLEKITHFFYDNQDRLIRLEEKSTENLYSKEFSISYKVNLVNEIILKYESSDSYSYTNLYTFEYLDDTVIITNKFVDINGYETEQSKTIKIDKSDFLNSGYGILTYYDNKKNLTEIIDNNFDTKNMFDDKKSIFKNVNTPQWVLYSVLGIGVHKTNNPIKIVKTENMSNTVNTSNFSYEYNEDGYPIKEFTTDDYFQTIETIIEYITK